MTEKLTYLVVENIIDVCEGIIERMKPFSQWTSLGYTSGINSSLKIIREKKPRLIFLDWSLAGGSAFEILEQIQQLQSYNPYIIFNTAYQRDNPEIPQDLINKYKVDKYLVKPIWENLRNNLAEYLKEAADKIVYLGEPICTETWLTISYGGKIKVNMHKLMCIVQHPNFPRCRNFYFEDEKNPIPVMLTWNDCIDLLKQLDICFFITKSRAHIVIKKYIISYYKPVVNLRTCELSFQVVKENIQEFEEWLQR